MNPTLSEIKIEKAKSEDCTEILELMEETGRTIFFTGKESYEKFYVVRTPDTKKIICSFVIEFENEIAILKFLGVRKDLQGSGVGKYIVNKAPGLLKKLGIKRLYASTWEAPKFWEKTVFKEIQIKDIKDKFFLDYLSELERGFPCEYNNLLKNYLVKISN